MDLPFEMPADTLQTDWPATRAEGLRRIAAFQPRMGRHYQSGRNHDHGPADRSNVSVLSPYIARRMVTEEEAVEAALARHSLSAAEKFVQEVVWRSYWKGWLEMRPAVWSEYLAGLAEDRDTLARDRGLRRRVEAAVEGRTGIDAFDAWAVELTETGYLHNHARMWFASIWVFTLGLPWRLGADVFLRHLLDGDAASNTLSWRWLAGLHTRGKHYVAADWNIRKFTGGRFSPAGLARAPEPLEPDDVPPPAPIRQAVTPGTLPSLLLLTTEDLGVETMRLPQVAAAATLCLTTARSDEVSSDALAAFDRAALADAAGRAGWPDATPLDHPSPDALVDCALAAGAGHVVTPFVHVGWVRDWLDAARPRLDAAGITLAEIRRPWDDAVEPHATAGFFKVKKAIPDILRMRGLLG